jgi:putative acetyltransferase
MDNPNSPVILIRPEQPALVPAILEVQRAAFEGDAEVQVVQGIQADPNFNSKLSLMALYDGKVVGHLIFSPMTLPGAEHLALLGLGPIGVLPDYQNQGVGSALMYEGLEACRRLKADAIFVLGDPRYYRRFGFQPTTGTGFTSQFDPAGEHFQYLVLTDGALDGLSGEVTYHPAFSIF